MLVLVVHSGIMVRAGSAVCDKRKERILRNEFHPLYQDVTQDLRAEADASAYDTKTGPVLLSIVLSVPVWIMLGHKYFIILCEDLPIIV